MISILLIIFCCHSRHRRRHRQVPWTNLTLEVMMSSLDGTDKYEVNGKFIIQISFNSLAPLPTTFVYTKKSYKYSCEWVHLFTQLIHEAQYWLSLCVGGKWKIHHKILCNICMNCYPFIIFAIFIYLINRFRGDDTKKKLILSADNVYLSLLILILNEMAEWEMELIVNLMKILVSLVAIRIIIQYI